jgi:predicted permease
MTWSLPAADRDVMLGDLSEEFANRASAYGEPHARQWYWRQVRRSLRPNLRRSLADRRAISHPEEEVEKSKRFLGLEGLVTDLRDAVRALRATPSFTIAALIVLTLGIGATTAIFSVVDAVVLRGLSFDEHDRLVAVGERRPPGDPWFDKRDPQAVFSVAAPNYLDWAAQQQVFEAMCLMLTPPFSSATLREPGSNPEDLKVLRVTAGIFDVLRVRPALGRAFTAENEVDGRQRVAVLGDAFWRSHFGGNPDIVGRTIPLDDGAYEVMGVLPPGVNYPLDAVRATDLWLPYVIPERERVRDPRGRAMVLRSIARLKPGVSIQQAQAQMDQIASALEKANPVWNKNNLAGVRPLRDHVVGARTKSWMLMLLASVGIVLLIACANVANLLLARSGTREREVAVRAALGAGRWQLVRQLMVESLMLSVIGTILATVLAWWAIQVLRTSMPEGVPRVSAIALDLRVLATAAGLSLLTALLFGAVPALQLSKPDVTSALKEGGRASSGRGRQRMRSVLVVAEVALAVVLLVGAALFTGSFVALMRIDPGFSPDGVLTAQVSPRVVPGQMPSDLAPPLLEIVDRVSQMPNVVQASALAGGVPLSGMNMGSNIKIPGKDLSNDDARVNVRIVTPNYHAALRIPLKRGRLLDATDRSGITNVTLINEAAARKYFPGEDPIGRVVNLSNDDRTIVGIVGDVHQAGLETDARAETYVPLAQSMIGKGYGELVIRTSGDPYAVLPAVRGAVNAVIPGTPLRSVTTMEALFFRQIAQRRLNMVLLGLFGLLGLVISAVGIYGVMAYVVAQRTREIGVRIALGATPSKVIGMVMGKASVLVIAGLVIGGLGAWYLSAGAKAFLFGLEANDPRAFAAALVSLSLAALVASFIPARRAANVDPVVALRAE